MKPGEEDTKAHELVLIRRRSGGDDAPHKGGVWKIAYADFMTAMMAFFLVMWLINSTDKRVLTQVANYFNPMRLTDSTPHSRGINSIESGEQGKEGKQTSVGDPKDKFHGKEKTQGKGADRSPAPKAESKEDPSTEYTPPRFTEQALFNDPYGVLARIATQAPTDAAPTAGKEADSSSTAFRDPFDPTAQHSRPDTRSAKTKTKAEPHTKEPAADPLSGVAKAPQDAHIHPKAVPGPEAERAASAAAAEATAPRQGAAAVEAAASPPADKASQEALQAAKQAAAQKALQEEVARIADEIKVLASQIKGAVPSIEVTVTEDGVLISLTDAYDFGMFAIASAEPRPATVVIMEKIAKVVQTLPQPLIVRGHTDGRPYRSGTYDNWRLSTARAHMAYYMLVRGGVEEKRFERVEGYADRNLTVPGDPEAAQNRRIEILLRRPRQ
ncbi:MAG: MotB family protein [Hyphomonadaceae bacterium]|nr:MotB family protein [Hyphomonadaceae bacterium]